MVDIILDSRFGEKIHHLAKTAISHYRLIHYFKTSPEFIKNLLQSIY